MSANSGHAIANPTSDEAPDVGVLESFVYSRNYEEAGLYLLKVIAHLKSGRTLSNVPIDEATFLAMLTRVASAITCLLCDPKFEFSIDGYDKLISEHATLHAIFTTSAFGNADHILSKFGKIVNASTGERKYESMGAAAKMLVSYSLDSNNDLDFESVFKAAPRLALSASLGMLASIVVLSTRAHQRRERLLTLGHLFEGLDINDHMLPAISDAYMYSSYALSPDKHGIKVSLNRLLKKHVEPGVPLPTFSATRRIVDRPTMLIPMEWFTSAHAMYRCYSPTIIRLREKFRLIAIARATEIDEKAKELFDETIELKEFGVSLAAVTAMINKVKPDIIYYPSIGMAAWWVALSSVRLAPIQMMTFGHPATSRSDVIDYALIGEEFPGEPQTFSETVFLTASTPAFQMRHDADFPPAVVRENPAVLRVTVPSMACKINAPFLASCKAISERASRPVEFHFFPAMRGLSFLCAKKEIQKWLPTATVYPADHYNTYLVNLARCDIRLGTYPFGGTNSNIDTLSLGQPMVTISGAEVHSQVDAGMMRSVGLPEWLITHSPAEFESAALRLIDNDAERVAISRMLLAKNIQEIFTDRSDNEFTKDFLRCVDLIYRNHEQIQSSGNRYWTVAERNALETEGASAALTS